MEKLSEEPTPITQQDFAIGMGPAYTAGKYSCRLVGAGNEKKLAFMRIYKQIPLIDTENENWTVRKKQACGPRNHPELGALKRFTENGCTATPRLLGYEIGKQDKMDLVPGGYIIYLVWEKVTGDSLDIEQFWMYPSTKRQKIRKNFKKAYNQVLSFKYQPIFQTPTKIIVDSNDNVYVLLYLLQSQANNTQQNLRFRPGFPIPPRMERRLLRDVFLVLAPPSDDEDLPALADDVKSGPNGWKW
ncbi:uncharacterized protein N7518_001695 [Penicillium psychrosexuale]|uniref:uncharacterized protein n=1 Tax=Penicillium psychrosexuale TaxID=1002107 RepID=UPI002545755B|nr:uncharacterized protein N7518_001695 [Penicillium psychrosexuale]KAJ5799627.1 hypothetical protein N7518_001695 [Penicillium psychrosexuale]